MKLKSLNLQLIFILILVGIGCDDSQGDIPEHIQEVENLTVFTEPENQYEIKLTSDQVFPSNDEVLIGTFSQAVVDHNGRVYLSDNSQKQIFIFQPDGTFLTKVGNEGRGPGEFNHSPVLKVTSTNLLALDTSLLRMSIFSLDSLKLLKSVNLNPGNLSRITGIEGKFPGHFVIRNDMQILVGFRSPINAENVNRVRYLKYYLLNKSGEIIPNEILTLKERKIYLNTNGDFPRYPLFGFSPHSIMAFSNDNSIFSAWTQDFLIEIRSGNGEYLRSIYHPFKKVAIDKNELIEMFPDDPVRRRTIRNEELPDTWPALNDLFIDDENRIWVSTIVEDFDVYEWWVLQESGELITKFEWARDEPIEDVKNGFMYTRETDEKTGLQQVVRYRIEFEEV